MIVEAIIGSLLGTILVLGTFTVAGFMLFQRHLKAERAIIEKGLAARNEHQRKIGKLLEAIKGEAGDQSELGILSLKSKIKPDEGLN